MILPSLVLAPVLDTAAAGPLRLQLRRSLETATGTVSVDAAGVERVGLACLQVLSAARAAAGQAGVAFRLVDPGAALVDMAALAGLGDLLADRG